MLILCRLAVHKLLIRKASTLKSCIHPIGTYREEVDSDDDDQEMTAMPPKQRTLKKALKFVSNDKFALKMQTEDAQGLYSWYPRIGCLCHHVHTVSVRTVRTVHSQGSSTRYPLRTAIDYTSSSKRTWTASRRKKAVFHLSTNTALSTSAVRRR